MRNRLRQGLAGGIQVPKNRACLRAGPGTMRADRLQCADHLQKVHTSGQHARGAG